MPENIAAKFSSPKTPESGARIFSVRIASVFSKIRLALL
jgi:hypothetical protein